MTRLSKFMDFVNNPSAEKTPMYKLIREDLSDSESLKKALTSSKVAE